MQRQASPNGFRRCESRKEGHLGMHQAVRPAAIMLVLLLIVAVPAQAGSLRPNDVAQVLVTSRSNAQLRLRAVTQNSNLVAPQDSQSTQNASGNATAGSATGTASDSAGASSQIAIAQDPSAPNVETIELGDITGTVCDCGEIAPLPGGGGFPLYPLFALGAIPLAFLNFGSDEAVTVVPPPVTTTPTPATPTPTPTPTEPIPEPATLLLLGTGLAALGAKIRRRRDGQKDDAHEGAEIV